MTAAAKTGDAAEPTASSAGAGGAAGATTRASSLTYVCDPHPSLYSTPIHI